MASRAEDMERHLREAGLLTGETTDLYEQWLRNAADRGVSVNEILKITREHGITPEDFAILEGMEVFYDPDGKAFFLLPENISGEDAKKAVIMTYIVNAGTDYGTADDPANSQYDRTSSMDDYPETPYSSDEITRIMARQNANSWSYSEDVGFVNSNQGRMVTTPNGMIMGLGGDRILNQYSRYGGTTWGDIFMLNIDDPRHAVDALRNVVEGGSAPIAQDPDGATNHYLDLDRLLHHEERHSQQWADEGHLRFGLSYLWQAATHRGKGAEIPYEQDAGLADGGYK